MPSAKSVPQWVVDGASYFPLFDPAGKKRVVFSLGQSIFTPDDLAATELLRDERPYAGWLYGGVGRATNVGMVGGVAFAEDVQKTWHKWFGFQRPNGWDNQHKNEPGFLLNYERKWRMRTPQKYFGVDADFTPHAGVSLGNILTQASVGFTVRSDGLSWYVFFGAEGQGVLCNIFLDGNTFRNSHSVDKKPFVGDIQGGIAVVMGRARLAYTHILRTKEFNTQDDTDQSGRSACTIFSNELQKTCCRFRRDLYGLGCDTN
jgi:lipid A 3-O-deacylase